MEKIVKMIREKGGRVTRAREQILALLCGKECLLSAADMVKGLNKKGVKPDRTTIYRELLYLTGNGFVKKQNVAGTDYYEVCGGHHHHLVCLDCSAIKKVEMQDNLLKIQEKMAQKNKFRVTGHSLEFYGYCEKCSKNNLLKK